MQVDKTLDEKLQVLNGLMRDMGKVAIAFSAGVDSTLLLSVAHDELGDDVLAVTTKSPSVPVREVVEAQEFCRSEGIRHVVVDTHEFDIEGFDRNPPDRCYICKREIMSRIIETAAEHGFETIAEGSNVDDEGDYRPGSRAVAEMRVRSPLREAGLTKADVRALAKARGLAAWDKPALACLNTRFAYGDRLIPERLVMVDEAERFLRNLGFSQVRVRYADGAARIEVLPNEIGRLVNPDTRSRVVDELKCLGFDNVLLDLQGYRTGSMNNLR